MVPNLDTGRTNAMLCLVSSQTITMCNNNSGLENQTGPEMNSQCFLRSSPENRVSPRTSPNHHISNGPFNKVAFELFTRGEVYVESKKCSFCSLHAHGSNPPPPPHHSFIPPSLLPPSQPSSCSPPLSSLRLPRRESLPATRRPSNRAATCTSTTFPR